MRVLKLIFIVNPLTVISFLILTQCVLFLTKNRLRIVKGSAFELLERKNHLESLLIRFNKRNNPKELVDNQISSVCKSKAERCTDNWEWCTTYHPRFHRLSNLIRKIFLTYILKSKLKSAYTSPICVVQIRLQFKELFSWRKIYPLIREKRSSRCGKSRCEKFVTYKNLRLFKVFFIKEVYKINHHFHYDSKCVIYLVTCEVCWHISSIIHVHKGLLQKVVPPNKITSINIFWARTFINYWRIVKNVNRQNRSLWSN